MKIAFDVDGVVLRSIDVILDFVNRDTGRNIVPDDLAAWDLEPLGIDVPTLWRAADHLYAQCYVRPYDGAVKVLSRIYRLTGEPLLFITGRRKPDTARRQLGTLPWNPTVPEMIVTGGDRDKSVYLAENSVDFIVEDDTKYLAEYMEQGLGVGLMLQPWNRRTLIPVTRRFDGWADLEQWFLQVVGSSRA